MNQEFKDRVANLLIDARVNAVLAEAEAKPEGGYGKAGPKPGFDIHGRPRAPYVPPDRTPKLSPEERAKRLAAEKKQAVTHGESTINQDFKDRLINIIMEKKVGELGQRNAAAATANRLKAGEGNAVAKDYVKAFKAKAEVEAKSSKPMAEGNRSKALANATDPAKINKLQATSDKARFNKALDNNKPGNVALNQMLSKKKGVVESSKLMAEDNKKKPMIKINHKGPIGYKIADIGPGRTEHNVRTGDGWKEPTDKPKPSSPKS